MNVVVYRQALLRISETFVLAQAGALQKFHPQFVGLQPAHPSLAMPPDTIYLAPKRTPLSRIRKALYDFTGFAPRFHARVKATKPELVHAHFGTDGAAALPLVRALDVPMVVTLHGFDVATSDDHWKKSILGRLYLARRKRMWQRASTFICISEFIKRAAIEAGFPEAKLQVHYIGIDRSAFAPTSQPRERLVLFVGRLVPMKGCAFLLRAMRLVQDADPLAKLIVIGEGPLRAELEALSRELKLDCTFLGGQPTDVVRDHMRRARMLCVPSVTAPNNEREGLGIVILEAQAVGTPVVGFTTGGIPEAVVHEETGLLAEPEDVRALAGFIERFFDDEELWQRMSASAVAWIERRFDLQSQTRKLEAIYERAAAQRRTGSPNV
jgi:glycosyltransferase involved in cell wall biosynthesis